VTDTTFTLCVNVAPLAVLLVLGHVKTVGAFTKSVVKLIKAVFPVLGPITHDPKSNRISPREAILMDGVEILVSTVNLERIGVESIEQFTAPEHVLVPAHVRLAIVGLVLITILLVPVVIVAATPVPPLARGRIPARHITSI